MEFKSIDQLTISDCCNQLTIVTGQLKKVVAANIDSSKLYEGIFGGQSLTGRKDEIAQRFISLLIEDRKCFQQCKTLQQFENYLLIWNDGLWRDDAFIRVKSIKDEQEEKEYYLKCKNSIAGLDCYLHKYPHGNFSQSAHKELAEKRRNKHIKRTAIIAAVIIAVFVICFMNYHSSSYIQSESNITFSKKGGIFTYEISTDAISENMQVYVAEEWIQANIENDTLNIKVDPNYGDIRNATIHLYAYTTLFGINLWRAEFDINAKEGSGISTYLTVSGSTYFFDKYGSDEAVCSVETDGMNLSISSDDDWVTINKRVVEQGNDFVAKLVITTKENESEERTGTILVKSDNFERNISIKQNSGLATYPNDIDTHHLFIKGLRNGIEYHPQNDPLNEGCTYIFKDGRVITIRQIFYQTGMWFTATDEGDECISLPVEFGNIGYEDASHELEYADNEYLIGQCDIDGDARDELVIAVRTQEDRWINNDYGAGMSINFFKLIKGRWELLTTLNPGSNVHPMLAKIVNNNVYIYQLRCDEKYTFNNKEFVATEFEGRAFTERDFR